MGGTHVDFCESFSPTRTAVDVRQARHKCMSTVRAWHAAVALNGRIYAIGGNNGTHHTTSVECMDTLAPSRFESRI